MKFLLLLLIFLAIINVTLSAGVVNILNNIPDANIFIWFNQQNKLPVDSSQQPWNIHVPAQPPIPAWFPIQYVTNRKPDRITTEIPARVTSTTVLPDVGEFNEEKLVTSSHVSSTTSKSDKMMQNDYELHNAAWDDWLQWWQKDSTKTDDISGTTFAKR